MSLNRNKDCGITSSFSRVIKISDAETDEMLNRMLQEYAIEQYFLEHCDALSITLNDDDMSLFNG
jgi:hypothetical protein